MANNDFRPINAAWSFVHRITDSRGAAHCVRGACCYADRRVLPNYVRQQSRSNVDRHRCRGGSHGEFSTGFRSGLTNLWAASTCCRLRVDLSRTLRVVELWYVLGLLKTWYTIVWEPSGEPIYENVFYESFFHLKYINSVNFDQHKNVFFYLINLNRLYWYFFFIAHTNFLHFIWIMAKRVWSWYKIKKKTFRTHAWDDARNTYCRIIV